MFDNSLPVWRIAEALLFVRRFAETFEGASAIHVTCNYFGLAGRTLISFTNRFPMFDDRVIDVDNVSLQTTVTLAQVDDNLLEVMQGLVAPLYEQFAFFQMPIASIEACLTELTQNRF